MFVKRISKCCVYWGLLRVGLKMDLMLGEGNLRVKYQLPQLKVNGDSFSMIHKIQITLMAIGLHGDPIPKQWGEANSQAGIVRGCRPIGMSAEKWTLQVPHVLFLTTKPPLSPWGKLICIWLGSLARPGGRGGAAVSQLIFMIFVPLVPWF